MESKLKIIQQYFCADHERMVAYLILVETVNERPTVTYLVKIPDWHKYFDFEFHYNPPCLN